MQWSLKAGVALIKVLLIILSLLLSLYARENPFMPADGERDIPLTSNKDNSKPALQRATISLPKYARILQKVSIEYKNLDGSVESRSIELDNSIDWHLPIFISQNYGTSTKQQINKKADSKWNKIATMKYASFYTSKKRLKLVTKDKAIRNFLLVQPHRIVIDFDKDVILKGFTKINKNNIFSKIRVGNHDGYYRVVLELDGYYKYKMKKISDGYIFELR